MFSSLSWGEIFFLHLFIKNVLCGIIFFSTFADCNLKSIYENRIYKIVN
jgi:hypothetical protein